jgi:glycosyltransferase involved in cell wall biosynthesis
LGNIESLREVWGDSAIFTDINNTTEAAETLNKVIENESIREEFGKKALLRAHCFSSEQMVENYLELYNALLTCNSNRKSISTLL